MSIISPRKPARSPEYRQGRVLDLAETQICGTKRHQRVLNLAETQISGKEDIWEVIDRGSGTGITFVGTAI